jgi:hypothetical protein
MAPQALQRSWRSSNRSANALIIRNQAQQATGTCPLLLLYNAAMVEFLENPRRRRYTEWQQLSASLPT